MKKIQLYSISILVIALIFSCKKGPKVIAAMEDDQTTEQSSGIFDNASNETYEEPGNSGSSGNFMDNLHSVVVNKTLPADKYVYLNVSENGKSFWIATRTQDVTIGNTYFYRDGLLKTNFESKEYQKTFDTIYLVSNLVSQVHGGNSVSSPIAPDFNKTPEEKSKVNAESKNTVKQISQDGSIKIAEIVDHPEKYENKTVQITGTIAKVNPNIMNRNWYHLKDGSKDDFDFVVTSNTYVPEGHTITIKAEVHRNVDFGAGYKYDLILENGEIISR